MKIAQLIHPMFLTALGLHASLMFIPVGGDSEPVLIEEDVPLAKLTEDASKATTSRLPVPDPNAITGAAAATAAKTGTTQAANAQSPTRKASSRKASAAGTPAQVRATGNVRPTGTSTTPAATGGTQTPAATNTTTTAAGSTSTGTNNTAANAAPSSSAGSNTGSNAAPNPRQNQPQSQPQSQTQSDITTPVGETPPTQTADDNDTDADAGLIGANSGGTQIPVESPRLAALIASAQTKLPSDLESSVLTLAEALVYRAEGTDDNRAKEMRESWINAISPLASQTDVIEKVVPTVISDLELAYPLASSELRNGRSLDVCLDEKPSNAEIGLVFNSQGDLEIDPQILRSTGYEALNLELIAMLKDTENFPSDRNAKAYIYEIEIDYDAQKCVNLSELQS
ncbi:MAG: hypothetical protein AB8B99_10390 [Phormidesmis sp.]